MNQFLGTWAGPDEYTSEVEYTVKREDGVIVVEAIDPSDGEIAEVSSVQLHESELLFTARWPSTGRIAHCKFQLESSTVVLLTFTFTDRARLVKKHA
ncbi:MAG: hypothetical protein K2Q97_15890 [Burkholderiaceae bacterium]|nr:hypothetical protein [Burkholderiaceae bacterium]